MMKGLEEPNWLVDIRAAARRRYDAVAWPGQADEEWKRSDISKLGLDAAEGLESGRGPSDPDEGIVSMRGAKGELGKGPSFMSLGAAASGQGKLLQALLANALVGATDRLALWNLARFGAGGLLVIPPGFESSEPILVDTSAQGALTSPRLIIVAGEGSRVDIVHRVSGDPGAGIVNAALDLRVGEGARVGLYEIQDLGSGTVYFRDGRATIGRDAYLRHFGAEFGGRFVKSRLDCSIRGEGAEVRLDGAYHCAASQHMDLRTVQRHDSPRATSRAFYKGAVEGGGRSVFQGLIEVAVGASGTDAYLTNRNLLLGDTARSDSIPTLRIGNNDVRCSHGSTTGRLSDDEIFYLESRGFDRREARELLIIGYYEELLGDTPGVFRDDGLALLRSRVSALGKVA
ncbi:MAG: Fe-S cluster assembly protein SufD [Spirochaetota bacterium]